MRLSQLAAGACEEAFRAWRAGSGPLLPYVKSTPFVSLARYGGEMELADLCGLPPLPAALAPEDDELVVIDLPASQSVAAGLSLWSSHRRWPVLTLSHWYHPHGSVGDAEAAAWLLRGAPQPGEVRGYGLLLDADRYSEAPIPADRFNNQYELTDEDLPIVPELVACGCSRVAIVALDPPKDDTRRYAQYLAANGMPVRWIL